MARQPGSGSPILQPIVVGVVIALLVGGSAPWWWDKVFPPETPGASATTDGSDSDSGSGTDLSIGNDIAEDGFEESEEAADGDAALSGGGDDDTGTTEDGASSGACEIVIQNPLVTLHEEPDNFGLEVGGVAPGTYIVENVTTVTFANNPQRWFLITANGRSGWLQDSTILIDSKSAGCP